jgi:pimeloyl-ACP methyl ester carboxylesterase
MPFADIQGIKTRYEVLGEGPPLLLLAPVGFDDSISRRWADRVWRGFRPMESLTPHFRVIVYDRRESGGSGGCVEPLTWALCARHAKGLLDHLQIDQVYLLGGCVGCSVALALAAEFPERCRALLLHWPVGGFHWLSRGRANFDRHIAFVREHGLNGVADLARRSKMFWSDPDAGPWSSIIATNDAFAEAFVRQDPERYVGIVEESRDNLFADTLPAGATLLATSDTYPNQAFRYGRNAWAIQFHAELTRMMMQRWVVRGAHRFVLPGAQPGRDHLGGRLIWDMHLKRWLVEFLELIFGRPTRR